MYNNWKYIFLSGVVLCFLYGCSTRVERNSVFVLKDNTGIDFKNNLLESDSFNIIQYLYYYNGAGVAAGDLNNDGLPDLYFSANESENKLYLNQGNFSFKDITSSAGVAGGGHWSTGVAMADVNADGWLDIYVCRLGGYKGKNGRNLLFINNHDLTFTESAAIYGLDFSGFSTHASFFDYDRDGDLDVYLLNHSVHSVDNFGTSELRYQRNGPAGDKLMQQQADGKFIEVSEQAGILSSRIGYGLGVSMGDVNMDGWPDVYVSNDFHENDYLYLNQKNGTFKQILENSIGYTSQFSMGNSVADLNNDFWPDIVSLDMKPESELIAKSTVGAEPFSIFLLKQGFGYHPQFPRNMLQLNNGLVDGKPIFSEIGQLAGMDATDWSWGVFVEDMDNDGWKDLFITNGIWRRPNDLDYLKYSSGRQIRLSASDKQLASQMPQGKMPNYAFRNRGDLTFENVSSSFGLNWPGVSHGAAFVDLDQDGDGDWVVNNLNDQALVYENKPSIPNNFLKIQLSGKQKNTFALGARIEIRLPNGKKQMKTLFPQSGYLSSSDPSILFGLGTEEVVSQLSVIWPKGNFQILENVKANQSLRIIEDSSFTTANEVFDVEPAKVFLSVQEKNGLDFVHRENLYNDFEREPLMSTLLSTQGPRMAVADVDGNGWQDIYICGAKGQPGELFYQSEDGYFKKSPDFFDAHRDQEETDAVFFDADSDGDVDLYVVTGGGEYTGAHPALLDRLFFNDGQGNFQEKKEALPALYHNGSCVVPLDFNHDGAVDLFVGSRSVPGAYGIDPTSVLLQNTGGRFVEATQIHLPNQGKLGMVTDACVIEEQNVLKLVIVGEWMPVSILQWDKKPGDLYLIPKSSGFWNRVEVADLNHDGRKDLVLGNWGWNSAMKACAKEPLRLYVKDFDGNETVDPILTYYRQGQEYIHAGIDELLEQLPGIKKQFKDYSSFSKFTFHDLFTPSHLVNATVKEAVCLANSIALATIDGDFELRDLPIQAQISPVFGIEVFDFNEDGNEDILLAGNLLAVKPSIGSCSASHGVFLPGDGKGNFQALLQIGVDLGGEVRDLKSITTGRGERLILASQNNDVIKICKVID